MVWRDLELFLHREAGAARGRPAQGGLVRRGGEGRALCIPHRQPVSEVRALQRLLSAAARAPHGRS